MQIDLRNVSLYSIARASWRVLFIGLILLLLSRVLGMALPLASKVLIDDILIPNRLDLLTPLILGILVASVLQGFLTKMARNRISKTAHNVIADLRQKLHAHVLRFHTSYFDANKSGNLVKRIMDDVFDLRDILGVGLLGFFGAIVTASLAFILMLKLNVKLTLLTLASIIVAGAFLGIYVRRVIPISVHQKAVGAAVSGRLTESMAGIRVVKSYRAEPEEERAFYESTNELRLISHSIIESYGNLVFFVTFGLGILSSSLMYIGASEISAGQLTVGGLFSFMVFLGFMIEPVMQIVTFGESFGSSYAAIKRVRELFQEKTEYEDQNRSVELESMNGDVEFNQVSFAYDSRPILKDLSFQAKQGTVTAFVGPSGAGKSTIIGLIALLYSPKAGQILIDGQDMASVDIDSYRQFLAFVAQDTFLFDGSIKDNVLYARPNASIDEVYQACYLARVSEFAEKLENKYDTIVGERGIKLSGGQKQRISIARAILANPKILLLDEATSSLDSESEQLVQDALKDLMKDRTVFVIAHRLSTIKDADQILVIESGEIVEQGNFEDLIEKKGKFFDMWSLQTAT